RVCGYNQEEAKKMRQGDFGYFAALSLPGADPVKLRTVIDWFNWLFVFDDQLDDGPLSLQKEEACKYIDGTLSLLDDTSPYQFNKSIQPIQRVIQDIWRRVRGLIYIGAQKRWLLHTREYLEALRNSIDFVPLATLDETVAGYMDYRIHTFAMLALFSFVEYAYQLELPDEVFKNPSIMQLERIGIEIQIFVNDCVSYHREKDQNCPHNVVHLLRQHGFTEQRAYDRAHEMLRERYRQWYLAMAELPVWGEKVDKEVQRYIQGIQDVVLANVNWSFRTERYFGKNRHQVRET
ncbi:terpenoid synthase, partial [Cadophora sp. DSE1049]